MTKHILRFVVTIVILVALGLCLWFFVFKPDDTETTFSTIEELIDYRKSSDYSSNILKIQTFNNDTLYTDAAKADRYRIFGAPDSATVSVLNLETPENETDTIDVASFYKDYNYQNVLGSLDDAFELYASYTLFAENVSNKEMKSVKEKVNSYKSAIAAVITSSNSVIEYENICKTTASITDGLKEELANRYEDFASKYKSAFNQYYDLIIEIQNLVKARTFNGNFVYDAQTCYYDFLLMLNSSFAVTESDATSEIISTPYNKENLSVEQVALKKACMAITSAPTEWFDDVGETAVSEFLTAYLAVTKDYQVDLGKIVDARFNFFSIDAIKTGVAEADDKSNTDFRSSNINTAAKGYIKTILEFCGVIEIETETEEA